MKCLKEFQRANRNFIKILTQTQRKLFKKKYMYIIFTTKIFLDMQIKVQRFLDMRKSLTYKTKLLLS
jgi:hypothetical protein